MSVAFFTLFILLFSTLLALIIVLAVVVLMGWRRVSQHLQQHPEAARLLAEHVLTPLLAGEPPPAEQKPEAKTTNEARLVEPPAASQGCG